MAEERFLVVELPSLRTPFVAFTARHPDCSTEMVLMPRQGASEPGLTATFLVNGLRGTSAAELRSVVEAAYPGLHMWQSGGSEAAWLGQFSFAGKDLKDPTAQAVITFLEGRRLSESWVRTKGGLTSFRIHIPPGVDAAALAGDMRDHLAAAKASGQVHVVTSRSDAQDWRALVEQSAKRQ